MKSLFLLVLKIVPYMKCSDQKTKKMHKCVIESCSSNPTCPKCVRASDPPPRETIRNVTCLDSYIIPSIETGHERNLTDYIACSSASIPYLCAGTCDSFKSCTNCKP
uniref:Secreted protein n=1 Tax=Phakopsora pachyrhizi TaxID=170000 RepID=A0A0S1MJG9_PHAPC